MIIPLWMWLHLLGATNLVINAGETTAKRT